MQLLKDVGILMGKGMQYFFDSESLLELPSFVHDVLFGAKRERKRRNHLYTDLHVHIDGKESVRKVLEEASKRIDLMTLVDRTVEESCGQMNFRGFVEKLEQEEIEHKRLGKKAVRVYGFGDPFYLVAATEVYVKENQGVVIVGNTQKMHHDTLTLDEAVRHCRDEGHFWFLDHPFSIGAPTIAFRYPTDEEVKLREKWFDTYNPVIETGNHQNTLWMYLSNVVARKLARKHNLVGLANSDTHFNLFDIGRSRTAFPKRLFNGSNETALINSLQTAFSPEHKDELVVEPGYSSLWSFSKYMIWPILSGRFSTGK